MISVLDFGAIGDGVTVDNAAFTAGINAANQRREALLIPAGTYKFSSGLSFSGLSYLEIIGEGDPVLDFSSLAPTSSVFCFQFYGSQTSLGNIGAVTKGQVLTEGNKISSPEAWGSPSEEGVITQYKGQQFSKTEYITTDFTSADLYQVNPFGFKLSGVTIKGNPDNLYIKGFSVRYAQDIDIHGVKLISCRYTGMDISECSGGVIQNCEVIDTDRGGVGYGILIFSSQDITVRDNRLINCRHGVDCSGGYPSRRVLVEGNYCTVNNPHVFGISTHDASEDITIRDNWIDGGGIHVRGINTKVLNNRCYPRFHATYYAIKIANQVVCEDSKFYEVSGNEIYQHDLSNTNGDGIIYFGHGGENGGCERLKISNNIVRVNGVACEVRSDNDVILDNVEISGNDFQAVNETCGYGIFFIDLPHVNYLLIKDNLIRSNHCGIAYGSPDGIDKLVISGNDIYGGRYSIFKVAGTCGELIVRDNRLKVNGDNLVREEPIMVSTNIILFTGNVVENARGYRYTATTEILYDSKNVYINCPTGCQVTAGEHHIDNWL